VFRVTDESVLALGEKLGPGWIRDERAWRRGSVEVAVDTDGEYGLTVRTNQRGPHGCSCQCAWAETEWEAVGLAKLLARGEEL